MEKCVKFILIVLITITLILKRKKTKQGFILYLQLAREEHLSEVMVSIALIDVKRRLQKP